MVRAAASGAIDFARADPRDRFWWTRLNLTLEHLEDEAVREVTRMNHATAAALLARADLKQDSIDKVRDHADALVRKVSTLLFPWVDFDPRTATATAIGAMRAQWAAEWGDPESAATKAKIAATVAAMQAQLAASRAPATASRHVPRRRHASGR
jgi:uncharacterized protein YdgA (DUF945 family)